MDALKGVKGPVLDPFAGTGMTLRAIGRRLNLQVVGVEIVPEYIEAPDVVIVGDATALPFGDESFGAVVSSPVYGNGMNDYFHASDNSERNTYIHQLRKKLNDPSYEFGESNTARYHFDSAQYRDLHIAAWTEAVRCLERGGRFVLNTKNCADRKRSSKVASSPVTAWHRGVLLGLGLTEIGSWKVECPGNRQGSKDSRNVRQDYETVSVLVKR